MFSHVFVITPPTGSVTWTRFPRASYAYVKVAPFAFWWPTMFMSASQSNRLVPPPAAPIIPGVPFPFVRIRIAAPGRPVHEPLSDTDPVDCVHESVGAVVSVPPRVPRGIHGLCQVPGGVV